MTENDGDRDEHGDRDEQGVGESGEEESDSRTNLDARQMQADPTLWKRYKKGGTKKHNNRKAKLTRCPYCYLQFPSVRAFLRHVMLCKLRPRMRKGLLLL